MNCFAFEVVAEGEVAEHFKERVVVGCHSYIADVTRAETLLAGGGLCEFQRTNSQKLVFELIHTGWSEEDGRVILRNQHVTGTTNTAFSFEEGQIFFTQFVSLHDFHSLWQKSDV